MCQRCQTRCLKLDSFTPTFWPQDFYERTELVAREFRRQLNPTKASNLVPSMSNKLGSGVAAVAVNVDVPVDFRLNVP
jgi:hypothetical protein